MEWQGKENYEEKSINDTVYEDIKVSLTKDPPLVDPSSNNWKQDDEHDQKLRKDIIPEGTPLKEFIAPAPPRGAYKLRNMLKNALKSIFRFFGYLW